ncbi:putative manganese transporter [Colwellia sp. E150_009]|jgi:hypothetical protein
MNASISLVMAKVYLFTNKVSLPNYKRMLLPVFICILFLQAKTQEIMLRVLADAFWQVGVFVAFTLVIYHLFASKLSCLYVNKQGKRKHFHEVVIASVMGVLPGCGGAIIVITQFVSGQAGFGSVVAVLTATMGDAAFLLFATKPLTGFFVATVCLCVGIMSGIIVSMIHEPNFLRSSVKKADDKKIIVPTLIELPKPLKVQGMLWKWLLIPCVIISFLLAAQVDVTSLLGMSDIALQIIGALLSFGLIVLWAVTLEVTNFESIVAEDKKSRHNKVFQKVAIDTNFVVSWVVVAFLIFELVLLYGDLQVRDLFKNFSTISPLIGVLIGMIPGCGPQIITTSLYLSGAIPLSTQIGNAISNDGDALFPAIALSPKVALFATVYSSIPALIVAYSYFWLFE